MSHAFPDNSALPILSGGSLDDRGAVLAINAQHAFYPSDDTAHRASNDSADRTRTPIALIHAIRNSPRNPLSMGNNRNSNNGNRYARKKNSELHQMALPCVEMAHLGLTKMAIRRQATR
jgi:hypothetical protein